MPLERNIISRELNRIKDRHGLTHESWAQKSSVPVGTISRYLGYNCGVPNYMHLCSMLDCVGEDIQAFYRLITGAAEHAPDMPAAVPENIHPRELANIAMERCITAPEVKTEGEPLAALTEMLRGQCLVLLDGCPEAVVIDMRGYVHRSVGRPVNERVVIGPHEAFNEVLRDNLTLLLFLQTTSKVF